MNILITLPKNLIEKIFTGEKKYEMRKCLPRRMRIGEDGFFVVEKGTEEVRCWCRVDACIDFNFDHYSTEWCTVQLGVTKEYVDRYANGKNVYVWKIGKVIKFECLSRYSLFVDKNPQQFAYCSLSYGESF